MRKRIIRTAHFVFDDDDDDGGGGGNVNLTTYGVTFDKFLVQTKQ
jgi:hypothetical protein